MSTIVNSNLQFRQWGGPETPCELKERMKITVVSGLGEDVKVVRGVEIGPAVQSNKPKTEWSFRLAGKDCFTIAPRCLSAYGDRAFSNSE